MNATPRPTRLRRVLVVMLAVLLGGMLAFLAWYFLRPVPPPDRVTLVRVSDGDTLVVRDSRRRELKVRLVGVDAPELGTAASFRSALFAAETLEAAREIRLEPEPTRTTDRYGRLLGWVWVTDRDGRELLLNAEMIRRGHATLYEDTSPKALHYDRLR